MPTKTDTTEKTTVPNGPAEPKAAPAPAKAKAPAEAKAEPAESKAGQAKPKVTPAKPKAAPAKSKAPAKPKAAPAKPKAEPAEAKAPAEDKAAPAEPKAGQAKPKAAPAKPKAPAEDKAAPAEPKAEPAKPKATANAVTFRVDRDKFASVVARAARHIPARPSVPVLAGIRLDLEAGRLTLSAYDYDVSAVETITVDGAGKMSVLVPGRLLANIAAALPDQKVRVLVSGAKVVVTSGTARYKLLTMPVEDYPALPELPPLVGTFNGRDLAAAVKRAVVAAGRDDTMPMLTGVQMKTNGTEVTFAGTDRYRVSVATCTWRPAAARRSYGVVIPWKTLQDAVKMFAAAGDVNVHIGGGDSGGMLGLSDGNRQITTRLLDSSFPDYRKLTPTRFSAHADLPAGAFTDAVKRVVLVAERDTPVRLAFAKGRVVVEAADGDDAQAVETLPVEWTGEDMTIAFNSAFLLEGVAASGARTVRFKANAENSPVLLRGVVDGGEEASGYEYLVMPVRMSG